MYIVSNTEGELFFFFFFFFLQCCQKCWCVCDKPMAETETIEENRSVLAMPHISKNPKPLEACVQI